MPLCQDIEKIENLLQNFNEKLKPDIDKQLKKDIETLLNVLSCPIFDSIVKVKQSLNELNQELIKHPSILPLDFDISSTTGDLLLNIPLENNHLNLINNSDSIEPNCDSEQSFIYDHNLTKNEVEKKFIPQNDSKEALREPFYVNILPSKTSKINNNLNLNQNDISVELEKVISKLPGTREIKHVQLFKPEGSILGFSVVGLKSETKGDLGIFIENIATDGVAERNGQLQEGDQILAIDGQVFNGSIPHEKAIDVLQKANGFIEIVIARGALPDNNFNLNFFKSKKSDPVVIETESVEEKLINRDMVLNTEWAEVEIVEIVNDGTGLGFGIIGSRSSGVVVKTIVPGGVSDLDGRLRSGDHILQINDVNLKRMSSEQVAQVLRMAGSEVKLVVARPIEKLEVENVNTIGSIVPTRTLSDPEAFEQHLMNLKKKQQRIDLDTSKTRTILKTLDALKTISKSASESEITQSCQINESKAKLELPEMETFEVELIKDRQGLGITIAGYVCEKEEISGIFVKSIAKESSADKCKKVAINDQIIEVDGKSLYGYSNQEAVEVLRNTGKVVKLRLARYYKGTKYDLLQQAITNADVNPATVIQKSGKTTVIQVQSKTNAKDELISVQDQTESSFFFSKETLLEKWKTRMGPDYEIIVAQINKFKEEGGLGISLEGTVDLEDGKEVRSHHYIKAILPAGPVGLCGLIKSGDEILEVNGNELLNLNHEDVICLLKELPLNVCMVCSRSKLNLINSFSNSISAIYNNVSKVNGNSYKEEFSNFVNTSDRLVKAKSDGSLAIGSSVSIDLSRTKSRSLEPLTGLVMWSSEIQVIDLVKGERGLGFSILDYQDPMNSNETVIVIRSLVPGGIAQKDGRLIPGDRLYFVNDISLENSNLDMAVQALKGAPRGVVKIGVAKPLSLPESSSFQQPQSTKGLPFISNKNSELISKFNSNSMAISEQVSNGEHLSDDDELHFEQKTSRPEVISICKKKSFDNQISPALLHTLPIDDSSVTISNDSQNPFLLNDYFTSFSSSLVKVIKIKKGNTPLGLILEVVDKYMIVKEISENGAVFKDGRLQLGDCLIEINNENLKDITNSQARAILRRAQLLSTDIIIRYVPACNVNIIKSSESMQKVSQRKESNLLPFLRRSPSPSSRYFGPNDSDDRQSSFSLNKVLDIKKTESAEISKNNVKHTISLHSLPADLIPISDLHSETNSSSYSMFEDNANFKDLGSEVIDNSYSQTVNLKGQKVDESDKYKTALKESLPTASFTNSISSDSNAPTVLKPSMISCQWGPSRIIELNRESNRGLGISIVGGKVDMFNLTPGHFVGGIFVKNVSPGSVAAKDDALKRGDRILEVDGKDLRDATHDQAVEAIRNAKNPVKMVVQSLLSLPKEVKNLKVLTTNLNENHTLTHHLNTPALHDFNITSTSLNLDTHNEQNTCHQTFFSNSSNISIQESSKNKANQVKIKTSYNPNFLKNSTIKNDVNQSNLVQNLDDNKVEKADTENYNDKMIKYEDKEDKKKNDEKDENNFQYSLQKLQKKYQELHGTILLVELQKGPTGLGLSLAGNRDRTKMSVFICGLNPKGNAAKDGRIQVGDEILEVNGIVLQGRCHLNASATIKSLPGSSYKFVILRKENGLKKMAVKPLTQFPVHLEEEALQEKYSKFTGVRTVTLRRSPQNLGIMIIEGKHSELGCGVFISDIQEGSAAEQAGLAIGDMILCVNQTDLVGSDYDTAASTLKNAEGLLSIIVAKPIRVSNQNIKEGLTNEEMSQTDIQKEKGNACKSQSKLNHLQHKANSMHEPFTKNTHSQTTPKDSLNSVSFKSSFAKFSNTPNKTDIDDSQSIHSFLNYEKDLSKTSNVDLKTCEIKTGKETLIEISKEKMGLGLSIVGGSDTPLGVVIIHEVYPDGAAAFDGRLKPGDVILQVNDEDLRQASHDQAIAALRQTPSNIKMIVFREDANTNYTDNYEIISIELFKKPGKGLGLSIVGRKNGPGVYVSEVVKGGIAEADGRLLQGDHILEVNNHDLRNASHEHAAAILKTTMGKFSMKIGRLGGSLQSKLSKDKKLSDECSWI